MWSIEEHLGEETDELVHGEVGLTDDDSQRASSNSLMVGDRQRMSCGVAQVNVTPFLAADDVAGLLERFDDRAPRYNGQFTHTETSMQVSLTAPFSKRGNPSAANDRRWSWTASLIFFSAARSLFPWEIHPGREGHVATYHPSSSRSIRTRISIDDSSNVLYYDSIRGEK